MQKLPKILGLRWVGLPLCLNSRESEKLGRDEEAIEYLDKALLLSPETLGFDVHLNLGVINEKLQDFEKAEECYLEATKANPSESAAWMYLANLMWREKKEVEKAKVSNSTSTFAHFSKEYIKKALEANPKLAEGHYLLGQIYYLEGKPTEAAESLQTAIEINPRYTEQLKKFKAGEGLPKLEE